MTEPAPSLLAVLTRIAAAVEQIAQRLGAPAPAATGWVTEARLAMNRGMVAAGRRSHTIVASLNELPGRPVTVAELRRYNERNRIVRPMSPARTAHIIQARRLSQENRAVVGVAPVKALPLTRAPSRPHAFPAAPGGRVVAANPSRLGAAFAAPTHPMVRP